MLLLAGGLFVVSLAVASLGSLLPFTWWREFRRSLAQGDAGSIALFLLLIISGSLLVALAIVNLNRTLLAAYRRKDPEHVVDVVYRHRQRMRGPKVVAIGGGHGLNSLLRGIKEHTDHITAIVTVADDGGSSGRLRRDLGILPPGDFRNCIAALSDSEGLMSQLFQYRFGRDAADLDGHNFGNLYLTAMTAVTGSFESALEESSRVLAVRGRVIPSTLAQVTLCAEVVLPETAAEQEISVAQAAWSQVRGESAIGSAHGRVQRVYLEPHDVPAYPEAIRAILDADLIVAGPGSLYTSVLPNLLVPDLAQAISASQAVKVYVCNVATQTSETEGYDVNSHVIALASHVGPDLFPTVLANDVFTGSPPPGPGVDWTRLPDRGAPLEYNLITRDLIDHEYPWRHDPEKLAAALMELIHN
jgi:uncharacterized cofD-like protein